MSALGKQNGPSTVWAL